MQSRRREKHGQRQYHPLYLLHHFFARPVDGVKHFVLRALYVVTASDLQDKVNIRVSTGLFSDGGFEI